jgi:hypothetical protein
VSSFSLLLVALLAGAAPEVPAPDTLVLQRTACSGNCPVYTLSLQRNGRVHFVGLKDVALVGETDWKVEPVFAQHLFGEFERAGFLTLPAKVPTEVEEFPGVVLTLTTSGTAHRVQLGGEGTGELARDLASEKLIKRLAVMVDKLTASAKVVETDSKKKAGGCID